MSKDIFNSTQQGTLPCYSYHLTHSPALDFVPVCGIFKVPTTEALSVAVSAPSGNYQAFLISQPTAIGRFWRSRRPGVREAPAAQLQGSVVIAFLVFKIPTTGGSA